MAVRSRSCTALLLGVLACLLTLASTTSIRAQTLDRSLWGTNGNVNSIARSGNTLFIGGGFSTVGPCTGGGVPVDPRSGAPLASFPHVAGSVTAVIPDGDGGWYLGGQFDGVDGRDRWHLAHVFRDGHLDDWAPEVVGELQIIRSPNIDRRWPGIDALALQGRTLYVAGQFHTIDGRPRAHVAAFDTRTGSLRDWAPLVDGEVRCLVARGNSVYIGGEFTHVNGIARSRLAQLDARTGAVRAWDPAPGERVRALALDGSTLFVGGDFDVIGGVPRNSLAAVDAESGATLGWDPLLGPPRHYIAHGSWVWPMVTSLALHRGRLYVGGYFGGFGEAPRACLAAFDRATLTLTDFDARLGPGVVWAVTGMGASVVAGGALYSVGGQVRPNIAAFDAVSGHVTGWDPRADGLVYALAADRGALYLGGDFTSVHDWVLRNGLAALDLTTGRPLDWNPRIDGYGIWQLAVAGNSVYLVGAIRSIDGLTRPNQGAVDATTGAVLPWLPEGGIHTDYRAMIATDSMIIASGGFSSSTYPLTRYLAGLDPITGALTSWDPGVDGEVRTMATDGRTLYLTGNFRHVAGQAHLGLAALDLATMTARAWEPHPTRSMSGYQVSARIADIAPWRDRVYLGGSFTEMNGEPRADLAAVDTAGAALLPWRPDAGGDWSFVNEDHVLALAVHDSTVWVGGVFATMHGESLAYLARVDARTGEPREPSLRADGVTRTFVTAGDTMYVGGSFRRLAGWPRSSLAAFVHRPPRMRRPWRNDLTSSTEPFAVSLTIGPQPALAIARVDFTLSSAASVDLAIYDLQGRRARSLLEQTPLAAGPHAISVDTRGWTPGVYFCRLEFAGHALTRRLSVLR